MKLSGQCHCGQLEYSIDEDYIEGARADCDCRECQRATGALKVPFFSVGSKNFKITKGTGTEYKAKTGERCDKDGKWMFCAKCGTMVMWMSDKNDFYTVLLGTINEIEKVIDLPTRQ